MILYLSKEQQVNYTAKQLMNLVPCGDDTQTRNELKRYLGLTCERLEYCFSKIAIKYYRKDGESFFSPLITDQYAAFLYLLAHTIYSESQNRELADRLYALNKALHGLDVYYEVKLPDIFLLVHTVGTVLGRADYSDYLVVYQGVTVGGNLDLEYPTLGKGVGLFANSTVVGNSVVGEGAFVSAGSLLMDYTVPASHVCYGMHPENRCKPLHKKVTDHYFNLQEA